MRRSHLLVWLVTALGVAGCSDPAPSSTAPVTTSHALSGTVVVDAASSLTAAFTKLGAEFEVAHPGVKVQFNFAASSELATQLNEAAPGDVFASADEKNMQMVVAGAGTAGAPADFATNRLQIIVGAGNPKRVSGVADLAAPGLVVVTCSPDVPIGGYTQQVFDKAGVKVTPASLEANVKGIVTKVTLGEADAGVVYRTDVLAAGHAAQGIDIPDAFNVTARYPIAVTKAAANPAAAAAFVEYVRSAAAQAVLATFGFGGV